MFAGVRLRVPGPEQRRFPGFKVRRACPSDFPKMARMASEIFQHERDIDYFDKHHSVKMAKDPEATAIEKLLDAERGWRLSDIRDNQSRNGRHFMVATYRKKPAGFMTMRKAKAREEIIGWAEWQDPDTAPSPSVAADDPFFSNWSQTQSQEKSGEALGGLQSVIEGLTFVHKKEALLVPPNGLAVSLPEALESFRRAGEDHREEWDRWSNQLIPICLGQDGDVYGRNLVLRSLVISTTSWNDSIVGTLLLRWGVSRAMLYGWTIQTLASALNIATKDSFKEAGFVEKGRLDIFRDTQILLHWEPGPEPGKRQPEGDGPPARKRRSVKARVSCTVEANEKHDGEL